MDQDSFDVERGNVDRTQFATIADPSRPDDNNSGQVTVETGHPDSLVPLQISSIPSSSGPSKMPHTQPGNGDLLRRRPVGGYENPTQQRPQRQSHFRGEDSPQRLAVSGNSFPACDRYVDGAGNGIFMLHPAYAYGENVGGNMMTTTTTMTSNGGGGIGQFGAPTMMVPMQIGGGAWGNPVPNSTFQQASFGNCCYMIVGWLVCCPVYICIIILVLIFVGAMTWEEIFDNPWD